MAQGYDGLPAYYVQSSNPITPNLGLSLKGMDPVIAENMVLIDTAVGGGGSSVAVNSVIVSNPNFNNTTPAAPGGFVNVTWQVSGSNVSAYVPVSGVGTVTSFSAGDLSPLFTSLVANPTTTPALTFTLVNQNANLVYAGPASGGAAAPTFRSLVSADIATLVKWSDLQNAAAALTLANGTNATTFNQTSAVIWKWANTTPVFSSLTLSAAANVSGGNTVYTGTITGGGSNAFAGASVTIAGFTNGVNNGSFTVVASTTTTITVNNASGVSETHAGTIVSTAASNSPILRLSGQYNAGEDFWSVQSIIGAVTNNPSSILTFTHSGSTGANGAIAVGVPAGTQGTSGAYGLTFNGTNVGFTASGTLLGFQTSAINGTGFRVWGAGTLIGHIASFDNNSQFSLGVAGAVASVWVGDLSNGNRTGVGAIVAIGQQQNTQWKPTAGGPAYGLAVGGGRSNSSQAFLGFSPASGAVKGIALGVEPTVNQTGTATGDFTVIHANLTNTAFLGTNLLLLDLQTGAASQFAINSAGVATKYAATTLVSQGIPSEIVTVDLTAQTAAITATTLISAPATGMYRVSWSATITTAGTTSILGGTNGFQVVYTSPTDSVVKTTVPGLSVTSAANTTGTAVGGSIIVYAKTGTNIQYQYDYTSSGTAMTYELHIKLERL